MRPASLRESPGDDLEIITTTQTFFFVLFAEWARGTVASGVSCRTREASFVLEC